jgi:hypothetical protein
MYLTRTVESPTNVFFFDFVPLEIGVREGDDDAVVGFEFGDVVDGLFKSGEGVVPGPWKRSKRERSASKVRRTKAKRGRRANAQQY